MKEHHKVEVVRIKEVRVHPNADKLEIVPIEGYQAVVGKGQYKVGDLAYYIPPDSIVPDRPEFDFLWKGPLEGPAPLKRRRIAAKRLRGEWSEGLLMPLEQHQTCWSTPRGIPVDDGKVYQVKEGDDLAEMIGITHYDPEEEPASTRGTNKSVRKAKIPTTWRGWVNFIKMYIRGERCEGGPTGLPVYDVEALKKHMHVFEEGENVIATEKIHGSNARYSYVKGFFGYGHMYAGSRNLWKSIDSTCAWRRALKDNPWIEMWCKAHPGYALYGEITPTQKGYDYGSNGKVRFFLFDIRDTKGNWVTRQEAQDLIGDWNTFMQVSVPILYAGPFNLDHLRKLVDGPSYVTGVKHLREGIVIKAQPDRYAHNLGRVQLKIVSNEFLERDSK